MQPDFRAVAIGLALSVAGIPIGGFVAWLALTVAGSDAAGGAFIAGLFAGPFLGGAGAGANGSPGVLNGTITGLAFALLMVLFATIGQASGLPRLALTLLVSGASLGALGGIAGGWLRGRAQN